MKILALHSDFIEFEAKKKAIKEPETLKEKKEILPRAVDENWTLIFEHDPSTPFSKVIHDQKGFKKP